VIHVTRQYRFSSRHRLHSPALSDEENRRVFGKCNNPHGHGHNYVLAVRVAGEVDAETGLAVKLGLLDGLVEREVIAAYDHQSLDEDVEDFRGAPSTTENVAAAVRRRLGAKWGETFGEKGPQLEWIGIRETKRNSIQLPVIEGNI
jgi:6-pyruvoyltetrahydropterin/6-carboxytetrahydropterin synthase